MSNATLTINDNATLIIGGQGNYDQTDTNASQATLVLNGPLNISAKVDEGQTPHKYTLEIAGGDASKFSPEKAVNGSELSSHTAVPWGTIGKWAIITGGIAGAVAGAAAAYVYRRKMQNFITKTVIGALSSWLPTASTMATVTYVVVPLAIIGGMYLLVRKVCNEKKPGLDNEPKSVTREIAVDKKPQGNDDQKKTPKKSTKPSKIDSKINSDFRQKVVNANIQRGVTTKRRGSCIPGQTNLPNINNHESQISQSLLKKDDGNKIKNDVQTRSITPRPETSESNKVGLKDQKNDLNNRENRLRFETSSSTSTTDSEDSYSDEGAAESIAYRVKKFHAEQEGKKLGLEEESTPKKTMTKNQATKDESGAALHTFPSAIGANSKPATDVLPNKSISLPITPVYVQKSGATATPSSSEGSTNIKPITQSTTKANVNGLNGMQFAIFADEKSSKEKLQQAAGEAQKALEKLSGSSLDQKEVSIVMLSPKTKNVDTDKAVEKSPSPVETKQNVETSTPKRSPKTKNQHK